jgi:hypothetical protein
MLLYCTIFNPQYHQTNIFSGYVFYFHYCAGDKIEKNEMGGACSSDVGGERRVQGFSGET